MSVYGLGANLDAEAPAEINFASLGIFNSRTVAMVAVLSAMLCALEAIKLAKDFIFEAVTICIGNRSHSISHRLFSFASIDPRQLAHVCYPNMR